MVIRIDARKYLDDKGTRRYLVTGIAALDKELLPDMYLKGYPAVWSVDNNSGLALNGVIDSLYVGQSYEATYFEWFMKNVRLAGDRLHRINTIEQIQYNF